MAEEREDLDEREDGADQPPPEAEAAQPPSPFDVAVERLEDLAALGDEQLRPVNQPPLETPPEAPTIEAPQLPQEGPQQPAGEAQNLPFETLVQSMERLTKGQRQPQHRQRKMDRKAADQIHADFLADPPPAPPPPPDPPPADDGDSFAPLPGETVDDYVGRMDDMLRRLPPEERRRQPNPFRGVPGLDIGNEEFPEQGNDEAAAVEAAWIDAKRRKVQSDLAFKREMVAIEIEHAGEIDDLVRALERGRVG